MYNKEVLRSILQAIYLLNIYLYLFFRIAYEKG